MTDKEKLYQTNIYNCIYFLDEQLERIERESSYKGNSAEVNHFRDGENLGRIEEINDCLRILHKLQLRSFHGKELTRKELYGMIYG
jgi:hypothetical protein